MPSRPVASSTPRYQPAARCRGDERSSKQSESVCGYGYKDAANASTQRRRRTGEPVGSSAVFSPPSSPSPCPSVPARLRQHRRARESAAPCRCPQRGTALRSRGTSRRDKQQREARIFVRERGRNAVCLCPPHAARRGRRGNAAPRKCKLWERGSASAGGRGGEVEVGGEGGGGRGGRGEGDVVPRLDRGPRRFAVVRRAAAGMGCERGMSSWRDCLPMA